MALDLRILGEGVYTPREAARLIAGTPQEVIRWTRGSGPNEPLWSGYYQALDEDSTEISFLDLIELRAVKAMRRSGASLQAIRFAIRYSQDSLGVEHPLSTLQFKMEGPGILASALENDGELVSLMKSNPGQKVFSKIVNQSVADLEYDEGQVVRWRPSNVQGIVIDPVRQFGDPILDEFGLSSSILFSEFKEFDDIKYLSRIYEVPASAIRQAIRFEEALDRAAAA